MAAKKYPIRIDGEPPTGIPQRGQHRVVFRASRFVLGLMPARSIPEQSQCIHTGRLAVARRGPASLRKLAGPPINLFCCGVVSSAVQRNDAGYTLCGSYFG